MSRTPANSGWSSPNTPLAIGATTTGADSASASRTSAGVAAARTAPIPASTTGRRAAARTAPGSGPVLNTVLATAVGVIGVIGGAAAAASVAGRPLTSAGSVRCTAPGRSAVASRSARRMVVATDDGSIRPAHLVIGA